MRLDNEFVVPRPVDEAWTVLTDVERVAPCMPGAQLTEVVGDSYHGTVKVKVGPVVAQYGGAVRFTEMDPERHHVVLEAKGKERNGRGLASALVTADLAGDGDGTRVTVRTELTISGPLAQFGRGAIAEVSSRLLNQFVDRLKETVLQDGGAATSAAPVAPAAPAAPVAQAAPAAPVAQAASAAPVAPEATAPEATAPGATAPGAADPGAGAPPAGAPEAEAPEAGAPANLLRVAAVPILKRLLPPLIVIIALIVVLIVWLG